MSLDHVFRLKAWTVRKRKERYYISDQDHPKSWGKAYRTLRDNSRRASCGQLGRLTGDGPTHMHPSLDRFRPCVSRLRIRLGRNAAVRDPA